MVMMRLWVGVFFLLLCVSVGVVGLSSKSLVIESAKIHRVGVEWWVVIITLFFCGFFCFKGVLVLDVEVGLLGCW